MPPGDRGVHRDGRRQEQLLDLNVSLRIQRAGYVVVNDFSVGDWQLRSPTLDITTRVNGEVRQSAHTRDMIFSCRAIVEFLSRVMTLQPGTLISTGTPAGVGLCRQPPEFLRVGDSVTVEISGIGRLANRVVAEPVSVGR